MRVLFIGTSIAAIAMGALLVAPAGASPSHVQAPPSSKARLDLKHRPTVTVAPGRAGQVQKLPHAAKATQPWARRDGKNNPCVYVSYNLSSDVSYYCNSGSLAARGAQPAT